MKLVYEIMSALDSKINLDPPCPLKRPDEARNDQDHDDKEKEMEDFKL